MARSLGFLFLIGSLSAVLGCVHDRSGAEGPGSMAALAGSAPPAQRLVLPTPQTQDDARRTLEIAFAAETVGDVELAAAQFRAILATDFLTDAGRMNVYWHAARSHRQLGDEMGERDALEGFLLTASLLSLSEHDRGRAQQAETILISLRTRRDLGRPSAQIVSR